MQESLFNVQKLVGKDILLYNTFTKAFIKLDNQQWQYIRNNIHSLDEDHELIKYGFIVRDVNSQLDCYRLGYLQHCFSNKVLTLVIAPTMACNLACSYCFEGNHKKPGVMSEMIEDRIIDFVKSQKPQALSITWFGGEPLLAFSRILSLSKKFRTIDIPFSSTMITNGTLLSKDVVVNLHYLNLQKIQISMDGYRKDQNARRCFKNGAPTFDIVIKNLDFLLQSTSIRVGIQVTVDHNNQNACEELTRFIATRFPFEFHSNRIYVTKNFVKDRTDMGKDSGCFTNDELINNDIISLKQGEPSSISLPDTILPCMHKTISTYAIDADGYIYKCMENLGVPQESIGSLVDGKLSVSKLANKMLGNDFLTSSECLKCNILPICGGGCPIERCKVAQGIKKDSCSMYKTRFADLLPFYYNRKFGNK